MFDLGGFVTFDLSPLIFYVNNILYIVLIK